MQSVVLFHDKKEFHARLNPTYESKHHLHANGKKRGWKYFQNINNPGVNWSQFLLPIFHSRPGLSTRKVSMFPWSWRVT